MGPRKRNVAKENSSSLPTQAPRKSLNKGGRKFKLEFKHFIYLLVGMSVGLFVASMVDRWYSAKLVYTPFSVADDNEEAIDMTRFWGTYRPQVYMGMKTKSPRSLVTGLMWLRQHQLHQTGLPLRHACDQGDHLLRYGWVAHDGINFGMQDIVERGYVLRTEFVKRAGGDHGGDWTWRISGRQSGETPVTLSIFFYAATEEQGEIVPEIEDGATGRRITAIRGNTEELGNFIIKFPKENNGKKCLYHAALAKAEGLHRIKDAALSKMKVTSDGSKKEKMLYFLMDSSTTKDPPKTKSDIIFHQVTIETPFDMEIVFESGSKIDRKETLSGSVFSQTLASFKDNFDKKFESRFPLKSKGYSTDQINFAKAALSNMVGGIGHFYGQSLVQSVYQSQPVYNWPSHLLTAVPSRSFFPRGFLWDEGFHELLISRWDRSLSEEIIMSWLNLINAEGWIPREQILGDEARSKVPAEFVVQRNTNANPPTLFLAIQSIIKSFDKESITEKDRRFLAKIYPRLKAWYGWFNTTQTGHLPFTYRWRGRNDKTDEELNPKTLTSGLDDYPRASHPSSDERHVDLRCWMALASGTIAKIARAVYPENPNEYKPFEETHSLLTDNRLLKDLHWWGEMGVFADYGNHSERVYLAKKTFQPAQQGQRPYVRTVRMEKQKARMQFVNAFGYVSLFPFLLQILNPSSHQLNQILQDLHGEDALWTEFGLRSLSKRDPLYKKRNTEHDPPYWRGQIWVNLNFLAVRALKYYSDTPGPYSALAGQLYQDLRKKLVENMFKQYSKSGYMWENYDDITGKGQGSHPFTGWSALVVLIMSEQY